ncbi:DUF4189 domain-containing protein [Lysobacter sp. CA199]|uniref:DUF4189 domain-containing protein n=1 Tax=Lysobacter sp. CA199 TaxID=3455608 RepID=UPI003F8D28BF
MNAKFISGIILALLITTGSAHAEGGCPQGFYPQNSPSVKSCIPFPSTGGGTVQTGPKWSSRWGAIAQDKTSGVVGAVANRNNKRQAKKDALAECKARGGSDCRSELEYINQCVAIIQGLTGSNFSHAETVEQAIDLGTSACKKRGDTDCHIYYKACSLPVQVR